MATGEDALLALRGACEGGDAYGLVLLAETHEDGSGLELARAIRADPALADTRMLGLGAAGDAAESAGAFVATVPRPVRPEALVEAAERAFRASSPQ